MDAFAFGYCLNHLLHSFVPSQLPAYIHNLMAHAKPQTISFRLKIASSFGMSRTKTCIKIRIWYHILILLSWAFDCGATSFRQECGGYEVSGVLMSNSVTRLCDSNIFESLICWWLTGLLSFVDCALILVVVGKVPVVGSSCCGVSNVCRVSSSCRR